MKQNEEELLGSLLGAVKCNYGSKTRRIWKIFQKNFHKHRNLQIVNKSGGNVYFYLLDYRREEVENLIMELNGKLNKKRL